MTRNVQGVTAAAPRKQDKELLRKFKFAKINTSKFILPNTSVNVMLISPATDDDKLAEVCEDMKRIENVGEIVIKIHRGGESKDTTTTYSANRANQRGVEDEVHEKALKGDAKSHSMS